MIVVKSVSKSFDKGDTYVLHEVSFTFDKRGIYAITGESGSGKTTLIRLLAGLERPDAGEIWIDGELVSSIDKIIPAEKRGIGFVFQEYALFPHLTVMQNIAYGITKSGIKGQNRKDRAQEMLALVGLDDFGGRYPHQLSGGQQQRVALARAMAPNPALLILDEPFSNLDAMLRTQLRDQVFDIIEKSGLTALFVTHDTQDALTVADEVLILKDGKVIQKDQVSNLYTKPSTLYVASLFGPTIELDRALQQAFSCPLKPDCRHAIRDGAISINADCDHIAYATVLKRRPLGNKTYLNLRLDNGLQLSVVTSEKSIEDRIRIGFNLTDVLEFPAIAE